MSREDAAAEDDGEGEAFDCPGSGVDVEPTDHTPSAYRSVECPVCGREQTPRWPRGALVVAMPPHRPRATVDPEVVARWGAGFVEELGAVVRGALADAFRALEGEGAGEGEGAALEGAPVALGAPVAPGVSVALGAPKVEPSAEEHVEPARAPRARVVASRARRTLAGRGASKRSTAGGRAGGKDVGAVAPAAEAPVEAVELDVEPGGGGPMVLAAPTSSALAVHVEPRADQNPAAVYLAGLGSQKSRDSARGAMARIARELGVEASASIPWASLRYQHTRAIRAALVERGMAPSTINHTIAILKGVIREAGRLGQIPADDLARAVDVRGVRGSRLPKGRALEAEEVRGLMGACDVSSATGARNAALFAVLRAGGLRCAEVAALDVEDIARGSVKVRRGKGDKERAVPLAAWAVEAVAAWVAYLGAAASGPLFRPIRKGGNIGAARMSEDAVGWILSHQMAHEGGAHFSPHDFRRTYVSDLLDAGADLAVVQRLAGHSSPTTTALYDRRGEVAARRAADLLPDPRR